MILRCNFCHQPYHQNNKEPYLIQCGHSMCQICLKEKIDQKQPKIVCVDCQYETTLDLSKLPYGGMAKNYSVLDYISPNGDDYNQETPCDVNGCKSFAYFCFPCQKDFCINCLPNHNGHTFTQSEHRDKYDIENIKKELDDGLKILSGDNTDVQESINYVYQQHICLEEQNLKNLFFQKNLNHKSQDFSKIILDQIEKNIMKKEEELIKQLVMPEKDLKLLENLDRLIKKGKDSIKNNDYNEQIFKEIDQIKIKDVEDILNNLKNYPKEIPDYKWEVLLPENPSELLDVVVEKKVYKGSQYMIFFVLQKLHYLNNGKTTDIENGSLLKEFNYQTDSMIHLYSNKFLLVQSREQTKIFIIDIFKSNRTKEFEVKFEHKFIQPKLLIHQNFLYIISKNQQNTAETITHVYKLDLVEENMKDLTLLPVNLKDYFAFSNSLNKDFTLSIIGGQDQLGNFYKDIWVYLQEKGKWVQVKGALQDATKVFGVYTSDPSLIYIVCSDQQTQISKNLKIYKFTVASLEIIKTESILQIHNVDNKFLFSTSGLMIEVDSQSKTIYEFKAMNQKGITKEFNSYSFSTIITEIQHQNQILFFDQFELEKVAEEEKLVK